MNSVYFRKVVADEFSARIKNNHRYSLRAYARSLNIPVSALSEILSARRIPSYKLATKFITGLDLNPKEGADFLNSVAQAQREQPNRKRVNRAFKSQSTAPIPADLSLDLFRAIEDWYHYAILFLTEVEGFKSDHAWIAHQLGISQSEAKLAVQRLIGLGMLKLDDGRLTATSTNFTTADKHITTPALRHHIKQILEKAIYSLKNDPIEKRSMTAMTFAIDPDKLPNAKLMIEEFTRQMAQYLEGGTKKSVYEISICLFPLMKEFP